MLSTHIIYNDATCYNGFADKNIFRTIVCRDIMCIDTRHLCALHKAINSGRLRPRIPCAGVQYWHKPAEQQYLPTEVNLTLVVGKL